MQVSPQHTDSIAPPTFRVLTTAVAAPVLGKAGCLLHRSFIEGLVWAHGQGWTHIVGPTSSVRFAKHIGPQHGGRHLAGPICFLISPMGELICGSLHLLPVLVLCESPPRYMGKESRPNSRSVAELGEAQQHLGHWAHAGIYGDKALPAFTLEWPGGGQGYTQNYKENIF